MTATPEEAVRQRLLVQMMDVGYPKQLLSIERGLRELAYSYKGRVPDRRVDIVCFSKKGLHPLLMVECKAISLNQEAIYQVIGYNRFVKASFVAVANAEKVLTGWYDAATRQYRFIEKLPSYEYLMNALS